MTERLKNSGFFTLEILFAINPARYSTLPGRAFPNFKQVYQRIEKGCITRTSSSRPYLPPLLLYLPRIPRFLLPRMLLKGTAFVVHFRPAFLIPSVHAVRRGVILLQTVSLPAGAALLNKSAVDNASGLPHALATRAGSRPCEKRRPVKTVL